MTLEEMQEFINSDEGEELYALVGDFNTMLQKQFLPPVVIEILGDTKHFDYLSDYSFDFLVELVAKADDILRKRDAHEELSGPMRKFVKSVPLTAQQFVIADAVHELGNRNAELQAIKLIRGTFLDDDGGYCPLAEARRIYDAIMARGY